MSQVEGTWEYKTVQPYLKTLEIADTFSTVYNGPTSEPISLEADNPTDSLIGFRHVVHEDSDPSYNDDPMVDTMWSVQEGANQVTFVVGSYNNETHSAYFHVTMYAVFVPVS